ncbi:hypothetical protein [Sphingobacterium paludis]|uniref:Lipoprotein n=1 Tax=Sphingobacterium paludis TaxID=1476465 RepID=A0A4R7CQD6_9SPHI|nr:hypothetical protein [Sphingobacterium paludis]TDS06567.1 hypothetical protein B0I21_1167 [Sphingobacterium paludis]
MKAIHTTILYLLFLSIYACNQDKKAARNPALDSAEELIDSNAKAIAVAPDWIKIFNDFRSAASTDDLAKQKSYFSFPINADTTQIWYAVYDQIDEEKWPSSFPPLFSENDFEVYHKYLFSEDFKNGLSKVDLKSLGNDGQYTTPILSENKRPYYLAVHFDQISETLQLTLSYSGENNEQGEYLSEGEYALIYFFRIGKSESLKFDKMLFAG